MGLSPSRRHARLGLQAENSQRHEGVPRKEDGRHRHSIAPAKTATSARLQIRDFRRAAALHSRLESFAAKPRHGSPNSLMYRLQIAAANFRAYCSANPSPRLARRCDRVVIRS